MTVRFTLRPQSKAACIFVESVEFTEPVYLSGEVTSLPSCQWFQAAYPVTCDDIKPGTVAVVPCRLKRFLKRRMLPPGGTCDGWKNSLEE